MLGPRTKHDLSVALRFDFNGRTSSPILLYAAYRAHRRALTGLRKLQAELDDAIGIAEGRPPSTVPTEASGSGSSVLEPRWSHEGSTELKQLAGKIEQALEALAAKERSAPSPVKRYWRHLERVGDTLPGLP